MSDEQPSAGQQKAEEAQSRADRTGVGKEQARKQQSRADRAAYPKHGL
jgi:hypothetical protein